MRWELSVGNVVTTGLAVFLFIPGLLLAAKYAASTSVPVLSDIGKGTVNIWRAAS